MMTNRKSVLSVLAYAASINTSRVRALRPRLAGNRIQSASAVASALILLLGLFGTTSLHAQSGLKLGEDAPAQPKLDLGAAPRPAPSAPAAQPSAQINSPSSSVGGANVVTNGAWQVGCSDADCAMAQIGEDSSGTPILEMVVRKLKTPLEADGRTAIAVIDFITPLGVVLTSGLELKIDSGQGEVAPFQICTEQGCLVREPVDQGLIDRLKKGNGATASVVAANQGEVSAIISLSGFTKSYNSLR